MVRPTQAEAELLAVNRRFYEALESMDMEMMGEVWSAGAPVSCIHPGWTPIYGKEEVMASFAEIFEGVGGLSFGLREVHASTVGATAWITLVEDIEEQRDGQVVRASAMATNIFVREPAGWRLVHHHAAPFEPETPPKASERPNRLLN